MIEFERDDVDSLFFRFYHFELAHIISRLEELFDFCVPEIERLKNITQKQTHMFFFSFNFNWYILNYTHRYEQRVNEKKTICTLLTCTMVRCSCVDRRHIVQHRFVHCVFDLTFFSLHEKSFFFCSPKINDNDVFVVDFKWPIQVLGELGPIFISLV